MLSQKNFEVKIHCHAWGRAKTGHIYDGNVTRLPFVGLLGADKGEKSR